MSELPLLRHLNKTSSQEIEQQSQRRFQLRPNSWSNKPRFATTSRLFEQRCVFYRRGAEGKFEEDPFDKILFCMMINITILRIVIIQLMADKKRVLKEFQWFQVQTKVREIISQIMHPLEKKVINHSTSISKLQQMARDQKHKMEQITMMISNDQQIFKNGIFQNVQQKFHKQTVHIRQLEHKIQYLQNYINAKAKVLDKRLQESTEVLNGINEFKEYVKEEFNNQGKKIIESQSNVYQTLDAINHQITTIQINIDQIKTQHQTSIKKIGYNEDLVAETNQRIEKTLASFYQEIKEIKTSGQINGGNIIQMRQDMLRLAVFEKIVSKFESLVNEQIIRIDNLQFKIEVIQPIVSFTQINQYVHHILPDKYHKNVSIYYYNRYNQLIEEILNNNFNEHRVSQSAKGNMQLIKDVHKRAIKLVFKLKKEQLIRKGIDLDHLSHQKKEELLANIKLTQDFVSINQASNDQPKKVDIPTNNSKPSAEQVDIMTKELKERIEVQIKDSKRYIQNMEYLLKRDQQALQQRITNLSNANAQLNLNFQLEQKLHQQFASSVDKNIQSLRQDYRKINNVVKEIHEIMLVFNQIEKQDEKDRQGITLLGIRQRHKDEVKQAYERKTNRSVVSLKDECLSCSGNANYYNQFFKMACLTYTSSPINYDNQTFQRIEILDRLHHQLQLLHHILSEKNEEQIPVAKHKKVVKEDDVYVYQRYGSSKKIADLPSSMFSVASYARNISSSEQIRSKAMQRSSQEPRIVQPSELTNQILAKTHNRLFSRKIERALRQSKSKKEDKSKQRTDYMQNVSRYFKNLNQKNQNIIKM